MRERRPRLSIELTKTDKVIETLTATIVLLLWIGTVAYYPQLPEEIPSHFNAAGKADDVSSKVHIFILPVVATIIYVAMTLLNKRPHLYNYLTPVTAENARQLYTSATRLIRILKLIVIVIFTGIVFMTYKTALENGSGLGGWFLPVAIALLVLPTVFYLATGRK